MSREITRDDLREAKKEILDHVDDRFNTHDTYVIQSLTTQNERITALEGWKWKAVTFTVTLFLIALGFNTYASAYNGG